MTKIKDDYDDDQTINQKKEKSQNDHHQQIWIEKKF